MKPNSLMWLTVLQNIAYGGNYDRHVSKMLTASADILAQQYHVISALKVLSSITWLLLNTNAHYVFKFNRFQHVDKMSITGEYKQWTGLLDWLEYWDAKIEQSRKHFSSSVYNYVYCYFTS